MILITGATGFVGKNLTSHLWAKKLQFVVYERSAPIDYKSVETVVHLAGKAHDLKNVAHPKAYYEANFELTKRLYDAFLESSATKFIFISSVKASADVVHGVLTEEDIPNPQTHYGKSKRMAEEYIQSIPLPIGKSYFILRPCMIHGPGNKGNLNLLYYLVSKGVPWPLGDFENKRSFCSINNLLFIIEELIVRDDILSGVYNVADNDPMDTNMLISLIAKSKNRNAIIWKVSKKYMISIAKIGDLMRLPLNTERLDKLTQNYVVSNQKILNAIGKDLLIKAPDGMMNTLNSFSSKI
jgi:nucleoside-diphosphate-sugar epimerase